MSMFLNMTLSTWGDIGNIILGITSVFTAIVTAVVLCKQHKLQQEQHNIIAKTKRTTFQNETYNFHVFSHLQNKGV